MLRVQTGLEKFIASPPKWIFGNRIGLLCNPASVDQNFFHASELIHQRLPDQLKALYSPQHGFYSEKQDNMIESDDAIHPWLHIPVYSLYGKTRIPDKKMLEPIDILIIDLQDVGTRVYTFIYTMSYCLEAAKKFGKKVVVLDRPNPLNGRITEGNLLTSECASFVGRYPIPMRHGLTIGELSLLFNNYFRIGCDLDVILMQGWKRDMFFMETGLPWIPPSPNMPSPVTAMVYPGQVLWEGTNVSEGRGVTLPFEIFGAPFVDTKRLMSTLGGNKLPGIILRPVVFEPTFNKWSGLTCNGFQIHITDPYEFKPYLTTLKLLHAVILHHNNMFEWKRTPYEYEFERLPIDLIIGDKKIRQRIESLDDIHAIEKSWLKDLKTFEEISREFHLYT
ncbi:MAG: DUF1343 domain-containing protein [Deltaproteobacteria bacterium]|jgi:uncharacterized protein YbbC (DUF1343 family)|nr:DUF1343 domain-containing protein [Deltaproteobacteria bacterium]